MGRNKKEIDENEIDEIIALYLKERLFGAIDNLTNYGTYLFNVEITDGEKYIRKNGEKFSLYSKAIWCGNYNGKDYIGKEKIAKLKEDNFESAVEPNTSVNIGEINKMVIAFKDNPNRLTLEIAKIIKSYEKQMKTLENLKVKNEELIQMNRAIQNSFLNVFYISQGHDNFLNDMLRVSNEKGTLCYEEFKNIFTGNEDIINKVLYEASAQKTSEKVISLNRRNLRTNNRDI